jgi:hypothetical protein
VSGDILYRHHFTQTNYVTLECLAVTALFIRENGLDLAQLLARLAPDTWNVDFGKVPMRPGWQEHDPAFYRTPRVDIFAPAYRAAYQARLRIDFVYDCSAFVDSSLVRVAGNRLAVIKYAYGHGFFPPVSIFIGISRI